MDEGVIEEYAAQAKLHGKEMKMPPKALKIKKEDQELFDQQAKNLQDRLMKRYLERNFKNGQG